VYLQIDDSKRLQDVDDEKRGPAEDKHDHDGHEHANDLKEEEKIFNQAVRLYRVIVDG
jgi:hypothetical protein